LTEIDIIINPNVLNKKYRLKIILIVQSNTNITQNPWKVYWFVIISLYQESTTSDRTVISCFCTFFTNWNLYKNDKNVERLCIINLWLHNFTFYIMKRKLKQLWSTIPPILTKRTITSHINSPKI
jgi:hypothetical protein